MAKHIGIVACSAEGAALCYRTICNEAPRLMGEDRHPEITVHNNCLADYMGTSQDSTGNSNGSTTFWYYTSGAKLYAKDIYGFGYSYYNASGMFGMWEYLDYCGYGSGTPSTDTNFFNQYVDAYKPGVGFTYNEYKAEIDAGRPVLIHVEGHTMYGYGYDDAAGPTVILNDTWSPGPHTMPWGGSYSGLPHRGVTCMLPTNGVPEPSAMMLLVLAGLPLLKRKRKP